MNLRETIGAAVNTGNMKVVDDMERAVDRCAAMASTEEIGSMLFRLKYGGQRDYHEMRAAEVGASAICRIVTHLESWLRKRDMHWRKHAELLSLLVQLVLEHWLNDKCKACLGRGLLGVEHLSMEKPRSCASCNGRGKAILTPSAWARALGVSVDEFERTYEQPALKLQDHIMAIDKRTNSQIQARLGR